MSTQSNPTPKTPAEAPSGGAVRSGALLDDSFTFQSGNGDAEKGLCRLLHTDQPNVRGDMSSLSLAKELRMQSDCRDCVEMALKAHTCLIRQKYQRMLCRWKEAGCPDPGSWPALDTDLFLVSYLRMASALDQSSNAPDQRPAPVSKL